MAFLEIKKRAPLRNGKEARRPFWLRKTDDGVLLVLIGIAMAFFPATKEYCLDVIKIGGALAGVGVVHRNIKAREADKQ
ncbi:MAG: hypothetical protein Q7J65_04255 [Candidatus Marinimicrobia bacterium]|nr:hypothetical protein [Candidatus Neomarinimicrobiota bacterium]